MRKAYPVFFTAVDGAVLIEVPDLQILTEGTTDPVNAIDMARDAMELACVSMADARETIPAPSDIFTLDISKGVFSEEGKTIISLIDIDLSGYGKHQPIR